MNMNCAQISPDRVGRPGGRLAGWLLTGLLAFAVPWPVLAQTGQTGAQASTQTLARQTRAQEFEDIRSRARALRAELAAQRQQLQAKALPAAILERHSQLQAELERRADEFDRAHAAWQADPSQARLGLLDALLQRQRATRAAAPALPAVLPWGARKTNLRLPAQTNAAWYRILTRDERVQLAQAGGMTTVGGVRFTTLPEPDQAPQGADLAETPDLQLSAAIRAKAQELGASPVAIFNWVRNNVQFAPTWGATQSADGVLRSLRGNAIDTASLTIALLRASGIPARYQFGTVDVPAAVAMNWLGGLTQPEAALELLAQGGIAARGLSEGGQIKTIRMEHAWAIGYVNWSPSRGARHGGPALVPPQHPHPNAPLNAWVPLDASFKQLQITSGIDPQDIAPFNAAGALDAARQGATCTAASARQVNTAALVAHYAQFKTQAQQQLAALGTDARVDQVLGNSAILARQPPLLAGTLAFPTVAANTAIPALTPALRWRLQLSLQQGTSQILALDKTLPELEGQQLSLAFVPETDADAQALAVLLRPDSGGDAATGLPARIAAYLVRLKAQLRLGGQLVAEGGSFTLGQPLALHTLLQNPEGNAGASEAVVAAGETHVWAIQGQAQGAATPAAVAQRLSALQGQLQGAQLPSGFEQASGLLHGVASSYQASLDVKSRLYQRVAGAVEARLPALVRASSRLETEEAYGLVLNVRAAGVGLHVDRIASATATRNAQAAAGYARESLERASAQAHQLLNGLFGPSGAGAQSSMSGLAAAAAQGQTLWRADAASVGQVLAALDADSPIRAQIQQAAASGLQALLASSSVDLGGLPMDPLLVLDPQSGTAAYGVTSRNLPAVQLSAQRPGLVGWLGLADAPASKQLASAPLQAALTQLNTAQLLLGDIHNQRWQAFAGQGDVLDGIYANRLSQAASSANACDWLIGTLAGQLGAGLPATTRVNRAPVIASPPVAAGQADLAYSYAVAASDPDGDTLTFSLTGAPSGMAINNAGLIQWPRPVAGQFAITVQVTDGQAIAQQSYSLNVSAAAAGLNLGLALSPAIANPGQSVTLLVAAISDAGAVTRSATLNGQPLPLDAQGVAIFAAPAAGTHPVVVTANDGKTTVKRELILAVRDAADTVPPVATIASPEADAGLRGVATISGSATDANFAYYLLMLRPSGAPDNAWQEISRGLSPVNNGSLGQLDTSTLANGLYQIGLFVFDVNGAQSSAAVTVEVLGNLKLGQFRLSFADVNAQAKGLPLMLTRTYDSTKREVMGDFGYGWSASGQDVTVRKNMTFGLGWEVTSQQLQNCLRPIGRRRVSISLPDGGLYRFDARNRIECALALLPQVDIEFTPLPGPTGGVGGRVSAGAQLRIVDGALPRPAGGLLIDESTGEVWNPKDFELTTEEGFKYRLKEGVGILSVTDPYGNTVSYGAAGYTHSASLAVSLVRDAQGRITRAIDPNGKSLSYAYNAQGELESVTDREGKTTRFSYAVVAGANGQAGSGNQDARHLLASITDPRGQVVLGNQFDTYGRLTGTADALGQAAQQQFDLARNQQTVTDRRGNRTVYSFDADGNITQSVNALGQTSTYSFDANGNETSVTNALGEKTERTFDSVTGKQLSEKNALGHTTSTAYPTVGLSWQRTNPLSTTDARGNVTGYSYDSVTQPGAVPTGINEPLGRATSLGLDAGGNLRSLNIAGEQTTYNYDSQGRKSAEANGLGQRTTYAYDANGNETGRTVSKSVNGQTVTFTTTRKYDSENRLIEEVDPLGGKRLTSYNAAGKLQTQTDAMGQVTSYGYDGNARLTKTTYPDGTFEATQYDAEGNETARTDRSGHTTRMEYDALNRLVKTIHPDGSSESTEFDAAGRVAASVDRKGQRATMEYDAAGRQTASVDATGRRTSQTYDANGNRLSVTIADFTTRYDYDALNRLTLTTWPDGSTHSSVYRTDNRKQSETDARGVTTSYGYDLAGRLVSVSQTGVAGSTTYAYDETGAKVKQVDAMGRATDWTLDGNGRITSRKIQDGSIESSQYDIEGNRLAKKTFGGETLTFQYDSQNRVIGQVVPQGAGGNSAIADAAFSSSYSASGQLLSQQEQGPTTLNGTQSHTYDANDRLTGVTNPLGQISYLLDANGNVIERSVSGAGTVKSEFDAAGRLAKVIAPDGKQTRYTYDQAGRVSTVERDLNAKDGQAQVLVTYNRYDSASRITAVVEVRRVASVETLIAGQAMTRGTGGMITKIETYRAGSYDSATGQFSGTPAKTQAFEYDGNARLIRETRTQGGATTDTAYEYSAVGNRTKKTVTTAAGAEITSYTYDIADRLTLESVSLAAGGTRLVTYSYDGNGNLASKTEPGKVTLYRFDPQNRLIDIRSGATQAEAQAATPGISYSYDAQGNRVRKGGMNPGTYLIDSTHGYAQVALETQGPNTISYVRGDALIRQTRVGGAAAEDLFPLRGHLGTSLGAVDVDGNVVEEVNADAFGVLQQATGLKQTHLYTGEYFDEDSQLVYLRARWYDRKIGRFISGDPFEGRQRDPRSLARYAYAHSDPVHGTDPSGREISLGGTMATIGVMAALTVATLAVVDHTLSANAGRPSLLQALLLQKMRHEIPDEAYDNMLRRHTLSQRFDPVQGDGHHTIPMYLCGHPVQQLSTLPFHEHMALHTGLSAVVLYIEIKNAELEHLIPVRLGRTRKPIIQELGETSTGREGIANAIWGLYSAAGAQTWGDPQIGDVFPRERRSFVAGHTTCRR